MTQAEELWEAASIVGAASRPLPLFYCLSQAGRAICAAWTQTEVWRPNGHGISSRGSEEVGVGPFSVHISQSSTGMYRMVAGAIDSEVFAGDASISALWASLPGLPHAKDVAGDALTPLSLEPVQVDGEDANVFDWLLPKHGRFAYPLPSFLGDWTRGEVDEDAQLSATRQAVQSYPSMDGVSPEFRDVKTSWGATERSLVLSFPAANGELRSLSEIGDRTPWSSQPPHRDQYVVRPRLGSGGASPPSQLMTLWALVYALSQLARYHPDVWVGALNPDSSQIAVDLEQAMDVCLDLVPDLLVPAVTRGLMPRLMREAAETEADQAEDTPDNT